MPRGANGSNSDDEEIVDNEGLEDEDGSDDELDEGVDGAEDDGGEKDDDASFDEAAFMQKVESRIDRRLNAVLREVRKMQQAQPGQQRQPGRQQQQQQEVSVDVRGAMAAYRDYVGDELRFSGREEREAATRMAKGLIAQRFADGETDEDEVGSQVAKDVAATINGLRKQADSRVKAALKRQGLLVEQPGQAGVQGKGKVPGVQSELKKGAALAAARHNRGQ